MRPQGSEGKKDEGMSDWRQTVEPLGSFRAVTSGSRTRQGLFPGAVPPRELLEQSPDDDGFIPGLEIDGIDRDLVEVPALMRALLHVDMRVPRREGQLHGPA